MALSSGPGQIVHSEWVLMEVADGMAARSQRKGFVDLMPVEFGRVVQVVPASTELFARG